MVIVINTLACVINYGCKDINETGLMMLMIFFQGCLGRGWQEHTHHPQVGESTGINVVKCSKTIIGTLS
jgi:hypothetical protein